MRKQPAKLRARLEQLGFRAARRDAELSSDFFVRVAFDVVHHEHRSGARRQPVRRFLDARCEQRSLAVVLHRHRVVLHVRFGLRDPARAPQRVERAIDGDAVRPRSELRLPAIRRQRPEDLDPHFLRDVGGEIGVADQTPDDGVDVRRVLRPQGLQRPLIAFDGALDEDLSPFPWGSLLWSRRERALGLPTHGSGSAMTVSRRPCRQAVSDRGR